MTLVQLEHPEARAELRAGANWYDDPETGQELLEATRAARRSIAAMPEAWPPSRGWTRIPVVRRKGVVGFPYGVIYYVRDDAIVIIAYAHDKRRPGYWRQRVDT
ncbi:type II toxin-antitoxin system RelE/ParE family toxin [Paramicrobacterium agarici]|uniref:type II toxin-antitoxin system RelE/ParE family toxin n=1 Tax=Paramicrobacterium agarici TaxID=630514 RepID=UPI001166C606|nr:ParE-like toxin of type II ParDE toxin-antitoxin system [Microbacterium agarici]